MDSFRNCPICLGVHGREIYQCPEGHIICNVCVTKMNGDLCPQCRTPFGEDKIRNRILEELLDDSSSEEHTNNFQRSHFSQKMENFHCCPICRKVLGREIFQCHKGHIICHICITKVIGSMCPQCSAKLWENPRNRVLEEILDSQVFPCRFKDKGCDIVGERGVIMDHHNECPFNSDSLCREFGFHNCEFRLSSATRAEIVSHFENEHECPFECFPGETWFPISSGATLRAMARICRKWEATAQKMPPTGFWTLISFARAEKSPLFLLEWKMNIASGFLSIACVQVWSSGYFPAVQYKVEFSLTKPRSPTELPKSSSFPISGTMFASSIPEAHHVLRAPPITFTFPISLMKTGGFGTTNRDCLYAKISPVYTYAFLG